MCSMENYLWTKHSEYKMMQYALSKQRVKRVMRHPDRTEKSIVPGMVACMQIAGTSKNRQEIWVMYEVKSQNSKFKTQNQNTRVKPEEDSDMIHDSRFTIQEEVRRGDSSSNFPAQGGQATSHFKNLSPAQKFRLERQQAFAQKSARLANGGKILRVISVWRYPGTSPERDPIPAEILEEIRDIAR